MKQGEYSDDLTNFGEVESNIVKEELCTSPIL